MQILKLSRFSENQGFLICCGGICSNRNGFNQGFRPGQAMCFGSAYMETAYGHIMLKNYKASMPNSRHYLWKIFSHHLMELGRLDDGLVIETVVIPCDRGGTTVCVSSQVGCAMNCQFCYTGRMGLKRHLSTAEDSRSGCVCTSSPHKCGVYGNLLCFRTGFSSSGKSSKVCF